jgi:hypothetical protein
MYAEISVQNWRSKNEISITETDESTRGSCSNTRKVADGVLESENEDI